MTIVSLDGVMAEGKVSYLVGSLYVVEVRGVGYGTTEVQSL